MDRLERALVDALLKSLLDQELISQAAYSGALDFLHSREQSATEPVQEGGCV